MSANPEVVEGGRSTTFSEADGVLDVREPGLFRRGRERFCRDLVEAAAGQPGVRSAWACLASGSFRLEFEALPVAAAEMAGRFQAAVAQAIDRGRAPEPGGPRPADWTSLTILSTPSGGSAWETTRERPGLLRLRHPALVADRALALRVAHAMDSAPGIRSGRATLFGRELEVRFDAGRTSPASALLAAEAAYRRALRVAPAPSAGPGRLEVVSGPRRLGYLALAGGSFALTVVGLIVPGFPTVPFLLATSYYLARSSPRLNRALLGSPFFGPILLDLETEGGLHRANKIKLAGFALAVGGATVILVAPPAPFLILIAGVGAVSLYGLARIPEIPEGEAIGPRPGALGLA